MPRMYRTILFTPAVITDDIIFIQYKSLLVLSFPLPCIGLTQNETRKEVDSFETARVYELGFAQLVACQVLC